MLGYFRFYIFFILCSCRLFNVQGDEPARSKRPTICLNMIVKDEKDVIERCLQSILPIIDYWVIVDTGSTDGTQEIIKKFMKSHRIPGEIHERPWMNFSHNRNEALQLAKRKADYLFFIDADEYLVYKEGFHLHNLTEDFYYIHILNAGTKYSKIQLINNHLEWKWIGVLHEYISSPAAKTCATLDRVNTIYTTEGARSKDPQKYKKDVEILEVALQDEPNNDRYVFYLAQSYLDFGDYQQARENYKKRVAMGGWDQEVYWSLLKIAMINEFLEEPLKIVTDSYCKAFEYRPSRIEPLYYLANLYRKKGDCESGYRIATIAHEMPEFNDLLFVEQWIYDYGILLEKSVSAYWIGKYEECRKMSLELLRKNHLPENVRDCVNKNLGFANAKSVKNICSASAAISAGDF